MKCAKSLVNGLLRPILRCVEGNVAVMVAVTLPALLAAGGAATDVGMFTMKQAELQSAADAAAVAGAKELALAKADPSSIKEAVKAFVKQQYIGKDNQVSVETQYDKAKGAVTVTVTEVWTPFFAHQMGAEITPIVADATASLVGTTNVCVLALEGSKSKAIDIKTGGRITAPACAIYSNSSSQSGIDISSDAKVKAEMVCSVGGISGSAASIVPSGTTECPPLDDPLASRPAPPVPPCKYNNMKVTGSRNLVAGTYCGGLDISGVGIVNFAPGDYFIKDGQFKVNGLNLLNGSDVAFYLTGPDAKLDFTGGATVRFSGRKTGDMAGMLFFEDRANPEEITHRINTLLTLELTGTIYLSRGNLRIDPNTTVADKSAYTAIVVNTLEVRDGPELVLNANYGATDVPVPVGIRSSATVVLSK